MTHKMALGIEPNPTERDAKPGYQPIAIIGLSCKLPGDASNPEKFWQLLENGRGAWSEIPKDRFNADAFFHPINTHPGTHHVKGGHFLSNDVFNFDASFFNLSTEVAAAMDPQLRLQLETTYEAFENAGLTMENLAGSRTSVFAASFHRDYHDALMRDPDNLPRHTMTGSGTAMMSNRISHFFDLQGPSVTVDTGCSTSHVALHMACQSLQTGDSLTSVVTAGNVMLGPEPFISMSGLGLLSPDGRCYAFDSRASGYGRGEGVVSLILKPLKNAIVDGDHVQAIIRSTALNQDGRTPTITSPSQESQEAVIRECYAKAGLDPSETPYVEAHGTGTQVGDLTEATALRNIFRPLGKSSEDQSPLYVGSVKSNIGHLEAAAGLASVVKVVKAFQHKRIPPNHDYRKANKKILLDKWNMKVLRECESWPTKDVKRASINSFGYGGTNGHVVLEAPEDPSFDQQESTQESARSRVFVLGGNDAQTCKAICQNLKHYLDGQTNNSQKSSLAKDLAYTLDSKRSKLPWRRAFRAGTLDELAVHLKASKDEPIRAATTAPKIGFVFTGQGAQWYAMGRELIDHYPVFKKALMEADECISSLGSSWSIIEELLRDKDSSRVNEAEISMPLCSAVQIALVCLLRSWNINPTAVTGHSSGESAAAFVAGALDMRSAMAVQYYRGLLTAKLAKVGTIKGSMMAAGLSWENAQDYLSTTKSGKAVVGCHNSPSSVTLSGDLDAIDELQARLKENGIFARKLNTQAAFHSHHMEHDAPQYLKYLQDCFAETKAPLLAHLSSSVTGEWCEIASDFGPEHWLRYMLQPVLFADSLRRMCTERPWDESFKTGNKAVDILVEIGPHGALASPIREILQLEDLRTLDIVYSPSLKRSENAVYSMHELVGFLWTRGYPVDLGKVNFPDQLHSPSPRFLSNLPSYPWNHKSLLQVESSIDKSYRFRQFAPDDLLGTLDRNCNTSCPSWSNVVKAGKTSWLQSLSVDGAKICPASVYLAMAARAVTAMVNSKLKGARLGQTGLKYRQVDFHHDLRIDDSQQDLNLHVELHHSKFERNPAAEIWRSFSISSENTDGDWILHCDGLVGLVPESTNNERAPMANNDLWKPTHKPAIAYRPGWAYKSMTHSGIHFEKCYLSLEELAAGDAQVFMSFSNAVLQKLDTKNSSHRDPEAAPEALIYVLQAALVAASAWNSAQGIAMPRSFREMVISSIPGKTEQPRCHFQADFHDGLMNLHGEINGAADSHGMRVVVHDLLVPSKFGACMPEAHDMASSYHLKWEPSVTESTAAIVEQMKYLPSHDDIGLLRDLKIVAYLFMHDALQDLKAKPPRRMLPHHRAYAKSIKSVVELAERDQLGENSSRWAKMGFAGREQLEQRVHDASVNGRMLCRVGEHLAKILRGDINLEEVMGKDNLMSEYRAKDIRSRRNLEQLTALLSALAHTNPRARILEIGAGTGNLTSAALKALVGEQHPLAIRCDQYVFTDTWSGYFEKAQTQFASYSDVLRFQQLDIEKDPAVQFSEKGSFDIILANQTFHKSKDIRNTMTNVSKLLKPSGKLLFIENTRDALDVYLHSALSPSWWLSIEAERKTSPLLSTTLWDETLCEAGFMGVDFSVKDCESDVYHATSVIQATAVSSKAERLDLYKRVAVVSPTADVSHDAVETIIASISNCEGVERLIKKPKLLRSDVGAVVFTLLGGDAPSKEQQDFLKHALDLSEGHIVFRRHTSSEPSQLSLQAGIEQQLAGLRESKPGSLFVSVGLEHESDFGEEAILSCLIDSLVVRRPDLLDLRAGIFSTPRLYKDMSLSAFSDISKTDRPRLSGHAAYVISGISAKVIHLSCYALVQAGAQHIEVFYCGAESHWHRETDPSMSAWKEVGVSVHVNYMGLEQNGITRGMVSEVESVTGLKIKGVVHLGTTDTDNIPSAKEDSVLEADAISAQDLDFFISISACGDLKQALKNAIIDDYSSATKTVVSRLILLGPIATTDKSAAQMQRSGSQAIEGFQLSHLIQNAILSTLTCKTSSTSFIGLTEALTHEQRAVLVKEPICSTVWPRTSSSKSDFSQQSSAIAGPRQLIINKLSVMAMMSEDELDMQMPLASFGIDSLNANEFRKWLNDEFGVGITVVELSKMESVGALIDKMHKVVDAPDAGPRQLIIKKLSVMAMMSEDELDMRMPLTSFGIDSLNANEFRKWLNDEFGVGITVAELLKVGSIEALIDKASVRKMSHEGVDAPSADMSDQSFLEDLGIDSSMDSDSSNTDSGGGGTPATEAASTPSHTRSSSPSKDQVTKLSKLVAEHLGIAGEISTDTKLSHAGMDPLLGMDLGTDVEKMFGQTVDITQLGPDATFGDFCNMVLPSQAGTMSAPRSVREGNPSVSTLVQSRLEENTKCDNHAGGHSDFHLRKGEARLSALAHAAEVFVGTRNDFIRFARETNFADFRTKVYPKQAELVLAYIIEAFATLGCSLTSLRTGDKLPTIDHIEKHTKVMAQYFKILEEASLITITDDGIFRTATPIDHAEASELYDQILPMFSQHASELRLLHSTGSKLADCLSGKHDPLSILFDTKASRDLLEDVYTNSPMFATGNRMLGNFLVTTLDRNFGPERPRILELGAGTGGTTKYIIELLLSHGLEFSFTFTDISSSLMVAAKKKFAQYDFISYRLLDVEQDPPERLIGSYDIIFASNCVHATKNLLVSSRNIRKLLRPGGFLCLLELTRQLYWLDCVFGLLDGWWMFEDGRKHVLADEYLWKRTLMEAGFDHVNWTDDETQESDQFRVIAAFTSGPQTKRSLSENTERIKE